MLTPEQEIIRDEIMAAEDKSEAETTEPITEPSADPGTTRKVRGDWTSPTVQTAYIYRVSILYMNDPSDPAWGAECCRDESIVEA